MSRLDSHIRGKIAQRDSLNLAVRLLAGAEGVIVEFGLGQGRSYSHLRTCFPDHEIVCFDRRNAAHPQSQPPAGHLVLGELVTVLADPALHVRFHGCVILAHLDLGCGGPEDEDVPEFVVGRIHGWLKPAALVLSDQALTLEPAWRLERVETGREVQHAERYHVYRRRAPE